MNRPRPLFRSLTVLAAAASSLGFASAQDDFSRAAASARRDLDDALARLATQRQSIAEEKIPLAEELRSVTAEVQQQRRTADMARKERDSRIYDLNAVEARNRAAREEAAYIDNLLSDYASQFEARLHLAETARYADVLDPAPVSAESTSEGRIAKRLKLVGTALDRLEAVLGGDRFQGDVLTQDGDLTGGAFALFGPLAYFSAADGKTQGVCVSGRSLQPRLHPVSGKFAHGVGALLRDGAGTAPVDVSLGNAIAFEATRDTLWEHIRKGGFWVYPIMLLALAATAAAIVKWRQIAAIKPPPDRLVPDLLSMVKRGDQQAALAALESLPHPSKNMLREGIRHAQDPREMVEEVLYEQWLEEQPKLQKWLTLIGVTAATAPLLGLLGTVTGMITTFGFIQVLGTGDAKKLSAGIYEALITTEFGLVVAIPALLLHAFLNRRVHGILNSMEQIGVSFVNGLYAPRPSA
ncbi:MAG TPA: MotA/TolQ/ExbB proton channel family protein [Verrucomicrobiales bacterium]|nr:MotA/TolQ/ExbB proton channel family protein [Verrucomicrobiales bacterium]